MHQFDPEQITYFAKTDARGKNVPFGIKAKDRQRHMYVIGKTGMGKSTLLENMAVQDLKNGEGMAFIDPHGSTAETLLEYIPPERVKDVVYFAPFDMEYPISFNLMEDVGPDKRHLVVSGLMSTFKKIWVDAWSARMEYILSNTLLALLEYPDSTLLGVNRMLSDKEYRKVVIANIKDPAVKSFWVDEFLKYNERYMQEAGDAIKNKIGQFTANPLIKNIIGQPKSSFDIREMMDSQKILIMNLSKGLVGETNANLLGSMLITRIYLSAMSRADLSVEQMKKMPNFYFYVDEFQSFANETFANILSEARKYHLNLIIAHQYIEQMEEEVRDAVFGNVGTTVSFRVGPLDAEFLETVFTPQFLATDLVNLGFAQIYLSLMIDGIGSRPFSATTLPPIEPSHISCKDQIIAASRQAFAHPRSEVETAIDRWYEPVVLPRKPKENDKQPSTSGDFKSPRGLGERGQRGDQQRQSSRREPSERSRDDGQRKSPSASRDYERRSKPRSEESRPPKAEEDNVRHKSMDELRSVLKTISGNTESPKEAQSEQSVSHKFSDKSQAGGVVSKKIDTHPSSESDKSRTLDRKSTDTKPASDVIKNNIRSTQKPSQKREERTDALKKALETISGTKKDSSQSTSKKSSADNSKQASTQQEAPTITTASDRRSTPSPKTSTGALETVQRERIKNMTTDEITRKQLEKMLHVNGQERPPV